MVLEALMQKDLKFGTTHQLNNIEKKARLKKELDMIEEEDSTTLEEIREKIRKMNLENKSYINLSEIDKLMDTYMHAREGGVWFEEEKIIHDAKLDVDNFLAGNFSYL